MYFTKTPPFIVYIVLMCTCAYGAKKGLEQIGSFAWIVFFGIKVSLIFALILTFSQGNLDFIHPFFGPGEWEIVKSSTSYTSIFADFLFLGLIAPYIAGKNGFKNGIYISLVVLVIEISVAMLAFIVLFDYEPVLMLNYPFHETIRYINLGFLPNIETFFFPFWLIATFIRFSFYLFLNAQLFGEIFNIKEFSYLIPSIAIVFVFIGLIPETPTFSFFIIRQTFLQFLTPLFILFPILLLFVSKWKGDLKR